MGPLTRRDDYGHPLRAMTAPEILEKAKKEGFVFLLQSATELVFYKTGVPKLSPGGFTKNCTVFSKTALELIEAALRDDISIRRNEAT